MNTGPMQTSLMLDGAPLSIEHVCDVARRSRPVEVSAAAVQVMLRSRAVIESALTDGEAHYGINTGFGSLSQKRIDPKDLRDLQRNLVRSHAAGVGDPLPEDGVRAMMLILAGSFCRGLSGVRPDLARLITGMLNAGVTPVVPSIGSVGASGDLAPLAHIGLVLIGEGHARVKGGSPLDGSQALAKAGLTPITLEAKEGLALINGTHLMAAQGSLLCADSAELFSAALAAGAMSLDACRATDTFLDPRVHDARGQPGQMWVAAQLRSLHRGSQIVLSHQENDPRVQDPYSLRCMPQVLGAARDALGYVKQVVEAELGAVTDNPLVFPGDNAAIISAGNFHGMPLAIALDMLAIALAHVAGIAERRVFWMLSAFDAEAHLRPYLSPNPGVSSGFMIAQYTAAACCNEVIGLCMPASVSNISTSAGIEDYNSFGPRSAAKARRALELTRLVVAIELLCAAEGIEYQRPLRSGDGVEAAHAAVRRVVPPLTQDRPLTADIEAIAGLIAARGLGASRP